MALSCLEVIGGHYIRAAKVIVISEPIAIFYTGYRKS